MQEIETKENPLNLKVYINGIPDLRLMPKDKAENIFAALEFDISGVLVYPQKTGDERKTR